MFKKIFTVLSMMILLSPCYAKEATVQLTLSTDMGNIQLELYPEKAPETVKNFLSYVTSEYYDGLVFHRVIKGFMIQAGGFDEELNTREPAGKPVINESFNGLRNTKGTIAMARQSDPDSARSQFFINVVDNWNLDPRNHKPGYTVFGRVISGMDVAEKISKVSTKATRHMRDVPESPIHILEAKVLETKSPANSLETKAQEDK